jgi:hypothetical protein
MKTRMHSLSLMVATLALPLASPSWGQTTISNFTVTLDANALRDRLYDASTASALSRAPIHAAVLHLVDEAMRKNPGLLSAQDALAVMQNAINAMTNDFGNSVDLTMQDLTSAALPYLEKELSKKLPTTTVNALQTGWNILIVAEQQGLFSSVYSNLTTALPNGSVFSDVENVASSLQALSRDAASRVASLALPERIRTAADQAFRDAAGKLLSQVTSVKPEDALDSIVQTVPALRNNPLVQQLAHDAQVAGHAVVDASALITSFTNVLASLHQSVTSNANLLGQIASQQSDIIGSNPNPQAAGSSTNLARQISADISQTVDFAQNSLTFISTLFKIGGDAKTAQQIATVGAAAVKVANTVDKLSSAVGKLTDAFNSDGILSFGSALATGNLIGAVLDVFSIFGGPSGPSPDQIILDQISAVRQDIANLSQQMNDRFDRVDAALTNIMGQLDYNLSVINTDFNIVTINLDQIRHDLLDLQGQVQRLESETYSWIVALGDRDLNLALNIGLGYEAQNGVPMSYDQGNQNFVTYEGTFYTWAFNNASDPLSEPDCGDYSDSGLCSVATTNSPEKNLAYVNNFIASRLQLPRPFNGTLANPRVWSVAANAYSQLCLENPAWFHYPGRSSGHLEGIIDVGKNLTNFLNRLIAFNTNAPNTNLWIAVCNNYRTAVQGFRNEILSSLSLHYSTTGLGSAFNPFTNQFLTLVTSNLTTTRDGFYTTASVVSVTAMACSPTPDGMPIYFLDQNTLRRLDTNGMITTVAGRTNAGFVSPTNGLFNNPQGLAVAADGLVYVADTGNHAIRVVGPDRSINTLAGHWKAFGVLRSLMPQSGAVDGSGTNAYFNSPRALIIDTNGDLLVADTGNHAIRKVTPAGVVTTFAGTLGNGGVRNGLTVAATQGTNSLIAQFWMPDGLARDTNGVIYVTDRISGSIRTITAAGVVARYTGQNSLAGLAFPQTLAGNSGPLIASALRTSFIRISAGGYEDLSDYPDNWDLGGYAMALRGDGNVMAWGNNYYSQCSVPAGLRTVVNLAAGSGDGMALKEDGTVAAWGYDWFGEDNPPAGLSNVVAIAAGWSHSLALKNDGALVAWGFNAYGQTSVPAGLAGVVAVAAGGYHSLALRQDGTVAAWGYNYSGEATVPSGLTNVVAIGAGASHSLALKNDGTVAAWGNNGYGQCTVPSGLNNVVAIAAGLEHSLALTRDGTVVVWGLQDWGNVPAALGDAVGVAGGAGFSLAVKRDGTLAAWGNDDYSQCDVPTPALPAQTPSPLDVFIANAAVQQFTAGVITPDGRILVADKLGLRLFDFSDRYQRPAADYLVSELGKSSDLARAGNTLKAWHLLLQTLATYALSDALATDDALHALLFGSDCLVDTDSAAATLNNLGAKADWRPAHLDFGATALQRIDLLESHLLDAVTKLAQKPNPATLPLVTDTLKRLNLLLATHDLPVPSPALCFALGTNQTAQVLLNGYPYIHYALQSSPDVQTWTTNAVGLKDGGETSVNTATAHAKFYRAVQTQ